MSMPMRVLYSADQLGRSLLSSQARVEDLTGLAQGQKQSLSIPRNSINDEPGPSSSIPRSRREISSERFRSRRSANHADREVDGFLAEATTPLELPIVQEGISGPQTTTPSDLAIVGGGEYGPSKTIPSEHKALLHRISNWFRDRDEQSAEYGLSPEQAKHTSLADLGIQPEDVLAQCVTMYHKDNYFWEELHNLRCECGWPTHRLELMDQIKYHLLNDPRWYRYQDPGNALDNASVYESPIETAVDAPGMAMSLSDLPVTLHNLIYQDRVNMSWLHDPYCACQRPEHRAQLRREWGDARKALGGREFQEHLEEYLLGHMRVARSEGYIGDHTSSPQEPSQNISKPRAPAVTRMGMINRHTSSAAPSEVVEANPFTEFPSTESPKNHALQDYQMQLMLLEQKNKKRMLQARQEQDQRVYGPLSNLFPDYAGQPLESRAVPFDVLVKRYQEVVAAASFRCISFHCTPTSPDALDIPSLLVDQQRQEDAYRRGNQGARGRSHLGGSGINATTLSRARNCWVRETRFTADVEQAETDSPFAIARRFDKKYKARRNKVVLKERAAIRDEFNKERLASSTDKISDEALAIQAQWPPPSAYYVMKHLETKLEEERAANQAPSGRDTARLNLLQASLQVVRASLRKELNEQSRFPPEYRNLFDTNIQAAPELDTPTRVSRPDGGFQGIEQEMLRAWRATHLVDDVADFEQFRMSMHDAIDQAKLAWPRRKQNVRVRRQISNNQKLSKETLSADEQLRMQRTAARASGIAFTQPGQNDSQAQQSGEQSSPSLRDVHDQISTDHRFPYRRPEDHTQALNDEDVPVEDFHCPYPACHDLLAGGEAALKVEKEGRNEIWCAHEGCLESFASKQRWGRHICTPHHDLLGLGMREEE